MNILVTGGAGYIGSITVEQLVVENHKVVVVDNLNEGHRNAMVKEAKFYYGDFGNKKLLNEIFSNCSIDVVFHFAADASVPLSMSNPSQFYNNNVVNNICLLDAMLRFDCKKMIFSSSAAIFGEPEFIPITEDHPAKPINPYGDTKLIFEHILNWYHQAYGISFNAFRYFNAAGASKKLGEDHRHESHIIPLLIKSIIDKDNQINFKVFGNDYPTKDGTCVRDYIHVIDIAKAHILGLENLKINPNSKYNLGNSKGFTNLEIINAVEKVSGEKVNYAFEGRRIGDPAILVASSDLAKKELGWEPKYTYIDDIIKTAWDWHRRHPNGYND